MASIFVAHGTADAVPIWFVTAATYADVRARLDAPARTFADAAGFEPKAGRRRQIKSAPAAAPYLPKELASGSASVSAGLCEMYVAVGIQFVRADFIANQNSLAGDDLADAA